MPDEAQYLPTSSHAMFSRIIERLNQQDRASQEHRQDIKQTIATFQTDLRATDGRVANLEKSQWRQRGFVAAVAFAIPLAWQFLTGTKS